MMDGILHVEDSEALQLAQQLAELTGQSVSAAVTQALVEQLARERQRQSADLLAEELVQIGRRCAATLRPPFQSADHADLYGEDGLPA